MSNTKALYPLDLKLINYVIMSEWTRDYFFDPLPSGRQWALCGYSDDEMWYDAITRMIESWEQVPLPEISAIEYRRPE
jgi:hypothetical protein